MTTLWGSDTNYSDAGKAWDATPTKVTPTTGQITQGFLPGRKVPMQWLNYAIATLGGRVSASSDEYTYVTAKSRTKRVPIHFGKNYGSWAQSSGNPWVVSAPASDLIEIPLADLVPSGCTITSVAAKVVTGAALSGSNKMQLSVWKNDSSAVATQIGSTASDNGSVAIQQITVSGLTEVVDLTTYEYFVRLKAAASGGADSFSSLLVAFTDIGPRNT